MSVGLFVGVWFVFGCFLFGFSIFFVRCSWGDIFVLFLGCRIV